MKPSNQVRRNLTQTAKSSQSKTLVRRFEPGEPIGPLLLPGIAGFYRWTDATLLQFVAQFITNNASIADEDVSEPALDLEECVLIAHQVLKSSGDEVFALPVPGLAAHRPLSRNEIFHYLASRFLEHKTAWKQRYFILPLDGQFEWAQLAIVCEAFLCREGVLEEIPYEGPAHRDAAKYYAKALRRAVNLSGQ